MWKDYDDVTNIGWTKNYGNLHFTLIRNAGHLVPADQDRVSWLMLSRYFTRWDFLKEISIVTNYLTILIFYCKVWAFY